MARIEEGGAMRIGEVLKSTRTRQGLDIRTVEERTKIRTKYLRALEGEEWETLPSPAYAKGFLRTYAQLLGLDADAIVDEYRRQVESGLRPGAAQVFGEPVLETRQRLGGGRPRPGGVGLIALGLVAVVAVLLVVGLVGGDGEDGADDKRERAGKREHARERPEGRQRHERQPPQPAETVTLRLAISSAVQVCLVNGAGTALIDAQVLNAGNEERFEAESFELRFPSGYDRSQFDLFLDGERARVPEVQGPASYRIAPPGRIVSAEPRAACP